MYRRIAASAVLLLLSTCFLRAATTETLVFVRHGEKPAAGLGQLDCTGLNRALALPAALKRLFGAPNAIFAPDPAKKKFDVNADYDYVRPLATIEPTAVVFGLPVNADFGLDDRSGLESALVAPAYHDATIFIAWEHRLIDEIVAELLSAHGGDATMVPKWKGDDFDSVYVVTLTWSNQSATARFTTSHEGLDGQSASCPKARRSTKQ